MRLSYLRFAPLALAGWLAAAAPAAADFRMEKKLPLAPGGELVVQTAGGGVTVTGGAGDGATVVITSTRDEASVNDRYTFELTSEPGRVRVVNKRRSGFAHWFDWGRGGSLHFEIHVPQATRVDLESSGGGIKLSGLAGEARVSSSGGAVHASDIAGAVEAKSSGGGVEVRRVQGNVDAHSSGGSVKVSEITGDVSADSSGGGVEVSNVSGAVDASSSGGGVHLDGIGGRVSAESSGGPVTAVLAAGNAAGGTLSSSGGGVHVDLARASRFTIDAYSSGGSVTCDLPVTVQGKISRNALHGNLNGGGAPLKVRSSGGGIRISPSDG